MKRRYSLDTQKMNDTDRAEYLFILCIIGLLLVYLFKTRKPKPVIAVVESIAEPKPVITVVEAIAEPKPVITIVESIVEPEPAIAGVESIVEPEQILIKPELIGEVSQQDIDEFILYDTERFNTPCDFYRILNCTKDSNAEEIYKKFHIFSNIYGLNKYPTQYKIICDAYKILYNEPSRKLYDSQSETNIFKSHTTILTEFYSKLAGISPDEKKIN